VERHHRFGEARRGERSESRLNKRCACTTEAKWWDRFGHIVDQVWRYDSFLTGAVRREYLMEMQAFLFKPGGRLLDFGCGTGQFSIPFAQRGMAVDGVDASPAQVRKARQQAQMCGLSNARFWCANSVSEGLDSVYDAVLLHALVHHIPVELRRSLLESISNTLVPGGKLYIYEPLAAEDNGPWQARVADTVMGGILRICHWMARVGRLYEPEISKAVRAGWTMQSPGEQPARLSQLLDLLPSQFSILKISPWHCWSVRYANFCMSLRRTWRLRLELVTPVLYALDRRFRTTAWYLCLRSWPLIAILAQKSGSA
jgi:2-polyprenyl-3-methyl-5-hydroxy-6-metoxy-1,4-benzoquinol methylase